MGELCLALLAFVLQTANFPHPGDCPRIEPVGRARLQALACGGRDCPVHAYYAYDGGVVYLDVALALALDGAWARSILLHELVHYLQDRAGHTRAPGCRAAGLRELEAFRHQERYLLAHGIRVPVSWNMRFYGCREG